MFCEPAASSLGCWSRAICASEDWTFGLFLVLKLWCFPMGILASKSLRWVPKSSMLVLGKVSTHFIVPIGTFTSQSRHDACSWDSSHMQNCPGHLALAGASVQLRGATLSVDTLHCLWTCCLWSAVPSCPHPQYSGVLVSHLPTLDVVRLRLFPVWQHEPVLASPAGTSFQPFLY